MITTFFNPLTPMIDQDRISPYNINIISSRQMMRTGKILIPQTNFRSTIWQTVRRIVNEILGVKGLQVKVKGSNGKKPLNKLEINIVNKHQHSF